MEDETPDPDDAVAVDLIDMVVLTRAGERVPVTTTFGGPDCNLEGYDGGDPNLVTQVVAGPTSSGRWITCTVDDEDREAAGLEPVVRARIVHVPMGFVEDTTGKRWGITRYTTAELVDVDPVDASHVVIYDEARDYAYIISLADRDGVEITRASRA